MQIHCPSPSLNRLVTGWALLFCTGAFPVWASEPSLEIIRLAVTKSLPLLQKGMVGHTAERTCFACHNQAMPILAMTTARGRGFEVNNDLLKSQATFIAEFLEKNKARYQEGQGQGGQVVTAGYALFALELCDGKPDGLSSAVSEYFLRYNRDIDHWQGHSNRPPSEGSPFTATYLALRALQKFGTPDQKERIAKRVKEVHQWLLKTPTKDTEDRVYKLWALMAVQADKATKQAVINELVASQRSDGGFAQMDTMKSDTYATGQVLVLLHLAGGMATGDPAYQRGLAYLLKEQLADGSWLVKTRSVPFQTYYESGYPHGKDQFISLHAASWATTALALACPTLTKPEDRPTPTKKVAPPMAKPTSPIDPKK